MPDVCGQGHVAPLVAAAVVLSMVLWLLYKQLKADPLRPEDWCFFLYWWNLAVAYEAVGRKDEAEVLWRKLGGRPDLPEAMAEALRQRKAGDPCNGGAAGGGGV